ncbi:MULTISPECIES: hypothetical protein [Streptomyces]|uniref:Addiction module toxin RelE n=1 Tax=Streptomyces canarius TaxID=285453 RepID=A0ABQ3D6Q3_9ACTN|nr:hypothetical protein [Streptomyces canarius]GHA58886.1 hypothetical protein GCM10010345_74050 [Streptomyces canarius]
MTYRLKYDQVAEAVHEAMPAAASEELTLALADACHDPIGATEPYGEDDGVVRALVTRQAFALLLVGETLKTITVLQLTHLG